MTGFLITLEGGEGGGKSTQGQILCDHLQKHGHKTLFIKNHAATPATAKIREMRLSGDASMWLPEVESLLLFAVWRDLWVRVIKPALDDGTVVVMDRFIDSTFVYQGYVRDIAINTMAPLHQYAIDGALPDITLLFDLPVDVGHARINQRTALDHFETRGQAFHQKVRDSYLKLAADNPQRFIVIDAAQPLAAVSETVIAAVQARLAKKAP